MLTENNRDEFYKAADSLKRFKRAEIKDAQERSLIDTLYTDLLPENQVYKMTDLVTGISGISRYSPAIAVSTKRDRVLFTHYFDNGYDIYQASTDKLLNEPVESDDLDFTANKD